MTEIGEAKEPHFISSNLLKALGGTEKKIKFDDKETSLVNDGACLWGVEDKEKGEGILKHVLLTSRVAYRLAKDLKHQKVKGYEDIVLRHVVEGAILHDITKLYGESREELPLEIKKALGIPEDFQEVSSEVEEVGVSWLEKIGFSPEVCEAIKKQDFPEEVIDNPYWKIILVADYMTGQEVTTIDERLNDVETRWINQRQEKGLKPRIDPQRFALAVGNINAVAKEIFSALGTSDCEFIEKHGLNSSESQTRWEKFLMKTRVEGREQRAKELVETFIG